MSNAFEDLFGPSFGRPPQQPKPEKGVQIHGKKIDGAFYVRAEDVIALPGGQRRSAGYRGEAPEGLPMNAYNHQEECVMSEPARNPEACVFCTRISRSEYDKEWPGFSFEPLNPVVPGHRLFVSPQHVPDASMDPEVTGKVFAAASAYAKRLGEDFNLITSGGAYATQTVYHLHVHYVPRRDMDGLTLPWTGQTS